MHTTTAKSTRLSAPEAPLTPVFGQREEREPELGRDERGAAAGARVEAEVPAAGGGRHLDHLRGHAADQAGPHSLGHDQRRGRQQVRSALNTICIHLVFDSLDIFCSSNIFGAGWTCLSLSAASAGAAAA